ARRHRPDRHRDARDVPAMSLVPRPAGPGAVRPQAGRGTADHRLSAPCSGCQIPSCERNIMKVISTLARRTRRTAERGMSTAEYAVGTLGACTVGGVLVKIGQSDWFGDLVKSVISRIPELLPF